MNREGVYERTRWRQSPHDDMKTTCNDEFAADAATKKKAELFNFYDEAYQRRRELT